MVVYLVGRYEIRSVALLVEDSIAYEQVFYLE